MPILLFRDEPRWRLCNVPDPYDLDPVVNAVLASLVEAIDEGFNWKLELGLRRSQKRDESADRASNFNREVAPAWIASVPALKDLLHLCKTSDDRFHGPAHPTFLKLNIKAPEARLYDV